MVERNKQWQGFRMKLKQLWCGWVLGSHADLSSRPQRGSTGELVRVTLEQGYVYPRMQKVQERTHC